METHFGVERTLAQREEDGGGEEVSVREGEELLKTFWCQKNRDRSTRVNQETLGRELILEIY